MDIRNVLLASCKTETRGSWGQKHSNYRGENLMWRYILVWEECQESMAAFLSQRKLFQSAIVASLAAGW